MEQVVTPRDVSVGISMIISVGGIHLVDLDLSLF